MSYLQLGFSALAAAVLLALAVFLGLTGAVDLFTNGLASPQAAQTLLEAYSLGLIGLLCLPSGWTALMQLLKKPYSAPQSTTALWSRLGLAGQRWDAFRVVTLLMIAGLPTSLLLGHLAAQNTKIAWLVLPPLNLVATGLPVLWLALLGIRKLEGGSAQQRWGVLACGLALGPLMILLAEIALLIVAGVLVLAYLSTRPELMSELLDLARRMRSLPSPDQEALLRMLEPYLSRPAVIASLFLFASVFVPMIEELLKPIGVWLLAWKKLTPAQGFVAGILSGAGFALFENLGNTSGAGDQWALVTAGRIPAALLHMLTSGMMGWGLASAWSSGRYLKLGAIYAAAITIHGLWNGMAILGAATVPVSQPVAVTPDLPANGIASVIGLIILCVFNLILFLLINRALRPKPELQAPELITN